MAKKQFKTESKRLLDMMVNSIYTNKEIFLREIISNASDAIDKIYFRSLTDTTVGLPKEKYEIRITANKEARTLAIEDNGCGMSAEDLEKNLGTIARSGSLEFKAGIEKNSEIDVIGQFGVGFYSAFMVADKIVVESKTYDSEEANKWESSGADGYTITPCGKNMPGTKVTLYIKADTEDENYSNYLEEYTIRTLIKKYSDFIRYPIMMFTSERKLKEGSTTEYDEVITDTTLNSITPIWKRNVSEVDEETYNNFYQDKFYDFEKPITYVKQKVEGLVEADALLFIPARAPYNCYSKEYEKGLQLYSSGVMIMEKCADLLPDYFSFVKGVVDSPDLSLNISREILQQDKQLKVIAKNIETKIKTTLEGLLKNDREKYETFFNAFGSQLKFGVYNNYGMHKAVLQDLLLFKSSNGKMVTLKEYVDGMQEGQNKIYYAAGVSEEQIATLPQVAAVKAKGFEILYLTEEVDEFAIQMMINYAEKEFSNVCSDELDIASESEKEDIKKENETSADMLKFMKEAIGGALTEVKLTNDLVDYAAAISNEGNISANMENTLNAMPGADGNFRAKLVLKVNVNHPIVEKLKNLYATDQEKLKVYSKIIYENARLISGLSIENVAEFSKNISDLM
ncbi:MAG: molecular chaperone HtpG [Clostridia bacterium]|nr:molecular chaperone HtpG [Clostridia bacterium]